MTRCERTRIKICGLTREEDVDAAVAAGADAIGFVFYPPSPRYVTPQRAAELARRLPPFVAAVGLFVNAEPSALEATLDAVPLHVLQFHGDESEADCQRYRRPYLKAARVTADLDLVQCAARFPTAQALLLDAFVEGYGGGGKTFDWSLIPAQLPLPVVLSGGLEASNVGEAVRRVRPAAVDVSSGVEVAKGIKDAARIRAFIAAVRAAETN
ncbi:MAG: phosphoribosylanthranilate isomerase [Azonexus sp.]|jgi:phosphoribosylanthranilate isomerase|nr:phosphoribosylanthranilate isomerase [Betaproteobacteria bacterium]MBK8917343.1 phosphoribosylanthranilate isomerase [Betaproteobacteria bacterium]MBP6035105.1 phosphoribosylanthranilate isomerase [Azonexus sp.]MBP6905917.1 phosphoribosylanthranilate isomerase [Azonexus sp.]